MNTPLRRPLQALTLCVLAALSFTASAADNVDVSFVQPDRFTDADRGFRQQETLDAIAAHLRALGQRELASGDTLDVQVLDVDLAGRVDPFVGRSAGQDIRVLTGGADWPRMTVRYTLKRDGVALRSGEDQIADMDYLNDMPRPSRSYQRLSHEKRMLDEWFADRFAARQVGAR